MSLIKIKNLSVIYFLGKSNEVNALTDVNLEINAGELIIFFGASGCGKSTLLYTIAGLETPTRGEVLVNGIDLAHMQNHQLEGYRQKTIGMVFQAFHLIPSLSVMKNVMLPKIAVGATSSERRDEAIRLMKYFGVYEQRNKLPTELSGGQQQRVAISRSLINDPDIIFADEPVGNLDSKSAQDVLGLIQELSVKSKKTVILVTHDPSHLDIADRVFFMKDGRIIDTKVNTTTRKITPGVTAPQVDQTKKTNLQLVSETFTKSGEFGIAGMLLDYKAKEIVSEALTGLTTEEISGIENYVKKTLQGSLSDYAKFEQYLDTDQSIGGLGLDKRSAHRLAQTIGRTVEDMKMWNTAEHASHAKHVSYVENLRCHLLDMFDASVSSTDAIEAIESVIFDRIEGNTDRLGVQAKFDTPVKEGGAGLDRRIAKRMAKHLELIMLGRYQPAFKEGASAVVHTKK